MWDRAASPRAPWSAEHFPFQSHYADVDGLRLHYLDEGEGRTVVCFHGEPSWSYLYRTMVPPLVAGGHRVLCPDYAGLEPLWAPSFVRDCTESEFARVRAHYAGECTHVDRWCGHVLETLDTLGMRDDTVVAEGYSSRPDASKFF